MQNRHQALKFGQTGGIGSEVVSMVYRCRKARHKGNKWQIRGNTKPPFGGFGLDRDNWDFFGCIISPLSYFARISANRASAQSFQSF